MAYRTLEMTLISAKDLKDVNFFSRMEVYVVASVAGDRRSRQRTPADREGGRNPTWNYTLRFAVPDSDPGGLMLHLLLRSERIFGDRSVGEVHVPVRELLDAYNAAAAAAAAAAAEGGEEKKPAPAPPAQFLTYQVMKTSSGKTKGVLNISYKFSDLMEPFPAYPPPGTSKSNEPMATYPPPASEGPVTAYPAAPGASTAYPPPAGYPPQGGYGGYPAPPSQGGYGGYPAPPPQDGYGGYPVPPPQPQGGYGGYPPPPQGGYGYGGPPPAGPYGYGALPPQQAAQPAKKNKFGMGLGAGLLGGAIGGMLLGDMVSDASAYDAGYDAGFDDGMDF